MTFKANPTVNTGIQNDAERYKAKLKALLLRLEAENIEDLLEESEEAFYIIGVEWKNAIKNKIAGR